VVYFDLYLLELVHFDDMQLTFLHILPQSIYESHQITCAFN
jgi:hypothetical protein